MLALPQLLTLLAVIGRAQVTDLHVPSDFPSIQIALDHANEGATVRVAPGHYLEALDFGGKAVRLLGTAGPDVTLLDGAGSSVVVRFDSGEGAGSVLEGFTITGGRSGNGWPANIGGGVHIREASPTIRDCVFRGNTSTSRGGAIGVFSGAPLLEHCTFEGNRADLGGALGGDGFSGLVRDCEFHANTATTGGAIWLEGGQPDDGSIESCGFRRNRALQGGALGLGESSTLVVTECVFEENVAEPRAVPASATGGAIHAGPWCRARILRCTLRGNQAEGGGAVFAFESAMRFENNWIRGNRASCGGAFSLSRGFDGDSATFAHNTIAGNEATDAGGAFHLDGSMAPRIVNSIIWQNGKSGEIFLDATPSGTPSLDIRYSVVTGGALGVGNLSLDPMLVAADDFRLANGSPCIDAANDASVPVDLEGEARPFGSAPDIGADEWRP